MINRLKEIMERTNYWLSFAEAKCAGMAIFNLTIIITLLAGLIDNYSKISCYVLIYLCMILLCNIISIIITLISMFPNLDKTQRLNIRHNTRDKNLIFYGDIASYNCGVKYVRDLYKFYELKKVEETQISLEERNYSDEIITISKISIRKYKYFKRSIFWTLGGFLTPIFFTKIFLQRFLQKLSRLTAFYWVLPSIPQTFQQ